MTRAFDNLKTGVPAKFVAWRQEFSLAKADRFIALHEDGELRSLGEGKTMGTYITDAPEQWRGNVTLEMEIEVSNPLVLLGDDKSLEARLWDRVWMADVRSKYDAIVSVPKPGKGVSARQGLLFYPQRQIHAISIVNDPRVTTESVLREFVSRVLRESAEIREYPEEMLGDDIGNGNVFTLRNDPTKVVKLSLIPMSWIDRTDTMLTRLHNPPSCLAPVLEHGFFYPRSNRVLGDMVGVFYVTDFMEPISREEYAELRVGVYKDIPPSTPEGRMFVDSYNGHRVEHNDFSAQNVLRDPDGNYRLVDFDALVSFK